MIILAYILSGLSLLMCVLLLIQTKNPIGWFVLVFKLAAGALSPIWAIMGAAGAVIGWMYQAFWVVPIGIVIAGMMIWYVWRCSRDHDGFEKAFSTGWSDQILPEQARHMTKKRWTWFLNMNASRAPSFERDIPFWTIPSTDRQLLCDIWRPANGDVSGLAFIYLHGGGWAISDKDVLTRPFFRHLVAQGHTVMDVSYRLCPEVEMFDMIGDVKRAVAWMKANASRYGVNPEKIVLCGASAGGHLALLAGYTPQIPELTPEDTKDADLSVCGIISYYGPTDLLVAYERYDVQKISATITPVPIGTIIHPSKRFQYAGLINIILGGHPEDALYKYQLTSPSTHVHPGCPPTLLIQGNQDFITSVDATCELYTKLVESGVPAINVVFPRTDHGFDLLLPQISPPAQSALYDVDRFLAILTNKEQIPRE